MTATVDLPTPPLPLATAMMWAIPGTFGLPPPVRAGAVPGAAPGVPCGAADGAAAVGAPRWAVRTAVTLKHAGQGIHRLLRRLAQGLEGRALPRVDLDRKADMAVADGEAGDQPGADDVAAAGGGDGLQGGQNLRFGDGRHA